MEYIDIRDENGLPTGVVREREEVHRDGDLHGTSHVWIVRRKRNIREGFGGEGADPAERGFRKADTGDCEVLLQKRSRNKDAYPGCYDISSAGHIPAGEDFLPSALRELREELGITALPEDLHRIGVVRYHFIREFHGKPFNNHEISMVFVYQKPVDETKLKLQEEEVESVRWMDLAECLRRVQKKDPQFCVLEQELRMIKDYLMNEDE